MAEKAAGASSKKKQDTPGIGHNLVEIRKKAEPALKAILKKFDDMESDMGSYRAEIKDLYEKHANALGCPRKILRFIVAQARYEARQEAIVEEMEKDERDELETLQAAFAGTEFGKYFAERVEQKKAA